MSKIPSEILNHHVIYGDWDDTTSNQFLVFYHPNGVDCTVFIMDGMDYGGGISYYFQCKSETVDNLVNQEDKYEGDIKMEIENLPEAVSVRKSKGWEK